MILPETYFAALLLLIFSMICWGSWANTYKATGTWRFELFYFDYSFGVLLAAVIAALTFGTLGDGLTFSDNLSIAGRRQIAYGLASGMVFNLGNILLVAAISVSGLSVAFPIGIGIALVIGVIWNYALAPAGNPWLLFAGAGVVVAAIIVDAIAYGAYDKTKPKAKVSTDAPKQVAANIPMSRLVTPKTTSTVGIVLSIASGIFMGSFYPVIQMGMAGDIGLKPYAMGFVFSIGVFLSTFVFNVYFMNLPVAGLPVSYTTYFLGTKKQHLLGVLGGLVWFAGLLFNLCAASAPEEVNVGPAISYALGQCGTMVSVIWGIFVWKEFAGASAKVRSLLLLMFILFGIGLALLSIAPLVKRH